MKNSCASMVLLSALLFFAHVAFAQAAGFGITGFRVSGNSLLPEAAIQNALAPFVGTDRTIKDVTEAADALRHAYANAGYPIVQVFPPEQTLTGGEVALRVVEGKIARISVAGNKIYDAGNIRASLPALTEGMSPNTSKLAAALTLANENPAKQVAVNFQAASVAGEVDARIDVTEDHPQKYIVNYDNAGSMATGYDRLSLAYQNANLANRDHMLTLQYATTIAHPSEVLNIVGGYRIPFYDHGLSLDLIGAYSDSKSNTTTTAGALQFTGRGTYAGARLNQSLSSTGEIRHKISWGIDYKDFKNDCNIAGSTLPSCGSITAQPVSAMYTVQYATPSAQAGGSIGYFTNLAGGTHGSQDQYTAARAESTRQWDVWRLSGFVAVPLRNDWQLRFAANGQTTDDALVPAEQFGLGGAASVRGYDERTTAGDYGFNASLELYTPDLARINAFENWQIRGLVFYDNGEVRRNYLQPGELKKNTLESIGFGVRASLRKDLSIKLDIAQVLKPWSVATGQTDTPDKSSLARYLGLTRANGPVRDKHESSAHVAVSYSF